MRPSQKLRPRLEGMESRALLSGAGAAVAAIMASPIPLSHTIHLNGTVKGSYVEHQANPDFPKTYNLFGVGDLGLKARTASTGSLQAGGFTSNSSAHGTIYLADAHGTITLKLTADPVGGQTGGLADQFSYTIVGGTGRYRNADGHGSIVLTLDRTRPPKSTTVPHGGIVVHGTYDMALVG